MTQKNLKTTLLNALAITLRPLVRVLLKYQVSYGELASVLRRTYVEVAYSDFRVPNRKSTYSKVAVMTGIDRKMIQEILNYKKDLPQVEEKPINKGLAVVKTWTTDNKYLDRHQQAKELPLRGEASFESLVAESCADITSRAVLDELMRVGVVEKSDDNRLKLIKQSYIPSKDEQQKIQILMACVNDLLLTGEHNLDSSEEMLWFQREVRYSYLPQSVIDEFKSYSNKKSEALINDINRWLEEKKANVSGEDEQTKRIGIGIYYIETENNGEKS